MARMQVTAGQQIEVRGDDYDEAAGKAIVRFVKDSRKTGTKRYAIFTLSDGIERRIERSPDYGDQVRFFSAKGEFEYSSIDMRHYLHTNARPVLAVTVGEEV